MTEMESGHFADGVKPIDARRQKESEVALNRHFSRFVQLAQTRVKEGRWLDIGCGAGTLMSLAQSAGFKAEGIELTSDRLQAAASAGFTVYGQPLEDLNFADDSFSVISLINVFSHLTDPTSTLVELRRVLRPGGVVVLATGLVGARAKKAHVPNWNLGDHLFFLGERTMDVYCSNVQLALVGTERQWLPDEIYSREFLRTTGGSRTRNAVKRTIDRVPLLFPAYRSVMLRKSRGNDVYSMVYLLSLPA